MASATTMPTVEPAQVPSRPSLVARVMVASIVLSPSSARKNAPAAAVTAYRRVRSARASSSSARVSPRTVQAAKARNARPAITEIARVGIAAPSTAPMRTDTAWTTAVATAIPKRMGRARWRGRSAEAIGWLLSPCSAAKMIPRLTTNACTEHRTLAGCRGASGRVDLDDSGAGEAVVGEVGERFRGAGQRVAHDRRADRDLRGEREQLGTVLAGVGGDAADLALLEQLGVVVERRDRAQVDAGDRQRPTAVERPQRHRHEIAGGCEQDRGVERFGRLVGRALRRVDAEVEGEALRVERTGHHVHARAFVPRHLRGEVGGRTEAVDAETAA